MGLPFNRCEKFLEAQKDQRTSRFSAARNLSDSDDDDDDGGGNGSSNRVERAAGVGSAQRGGSRTTVSARSAAGARGSGGSGGGGGGAAAAVPANVPRSAGGNGGAAGRAGDDSMGEETTEARAPYKYANQLMLSEWMKVRARSSTMVVVSDHTLRTCICMHG